MGGDIGRMEMVVSSGTLSQENWKIPQLEPFCPAWRDHYWNILHTSILNCYSRELWLGEFSFVSEKRKIFHKNWIVSGILTPATRDHFYPNEQLKGFWDIWQKCVNSWARIALPSNITFACVCNLASSMLADGASLVNLWIDSCVIMLNIPIHRQSSIATQCLCWNSQSAPLVLLENYSELRKCRVQVK